MSLIVDVSNVNGHVDFDQIAEHGIKGVFLKASEGETFVDPNFHAFRLAATAAGLHVGAYHFARPDLHAGPSREAANFCNVVRSIGKKDFRPVLDFETASNRITGAQHIAWARKFNQIVKDKLGTLPLFYTYGAFWPVKFATTPVGAGLWLASYGRNDGQEYPVSAPYPWKNYVAHQFTSTARIAGVGGHVDLSSAKSLTPLLAHPGVVRKAVHLVYKGRH